MPAASGQVGWWPGDGSANDIAGTNNGILQGGATASGSGFIGSAFTFDGTNSYAQFPDSPVFHPSNLTIEAWVRFSSLDSQSSGGSPAGDQYIVFKQNSLSSNFEGFDLSKTRFGTTDVFRFLVASASGQEIEVDSASPLTTNVWYHVAGVRGSNFMQIYFNGQLQGQTNVGFPQDYGTLPLFFGSSGQSFWDHKLKGTLDEVSLYNRALSSNEIAAIYAAGASGKCKAVALTAQPQSHTVIAGNSALFSVAATGVAPLSYQWQFNGAAIVGATGITLILNSVQPADAGNYTVVVTNKVSAATSAVAVLTVLVPPAITAQPQSRTNLAGTTANFSAAATGTGPLSYQWQFNGGTMVGATGTNLTLNNVQPADGGSYTVLVTNVAGAVTSTVATLTVWAPPAITAQPQSRTNLAGTTATFNVAASGTAPLSYQWQFNGAKLPNATDATLTFNNVQSSDAGGYTVVVTNSAGAATSAVAVLTVWVPPAITAQPQSRTNVAETTANFSVSASGTAPLSYQWQFNGANIGAATTPTLTLNNVQSPDAGNYTVVVTNIAGATTSAVAALTVLVPPTITAQPLSRTNIVGTTAAFNAAATGTAPLSYQWQFNGANIQNATDSTLTLNNVQSADAGGYTLVVTNTVGAATSAVAALTVLVPPAMTAQPLSRTNIAGTTATFNVTATGTAPLSYQWLFNGVPLGGSGATGTTLTLTNVQLANAGNYAVIATNSAGAATSAVAFLTVLVPPAITGQPQSRTNTIGTIASFSVAASGTLPLSYQWQYNGVNLADGGQMSGANTSTLTITSLALTNAGSFAVVVTNVAGSVTSAIATLTVKPPDCVPALAGLVSWWPGDGNANDLLGINNGVLQGGALANVPGMVGSALSFDGTNAFVQFPDSPVFHPANLTIEAWVRFSSLDSQSSGASPAGDQYIVFKQNSRSAGFEGFDLSKTRLGATDVFRFMVTSASGQEAEIESTTPLTTNVWYHVAGVRGPSIIQVYVNGQLERQTNVSFAQDYGTLPLFFGSSGQSFWDHKLKGTLDEVSLYNRALTANEIAAIYAAGASGRCKAVNLTVHPQSQTVIAGGGALFDVGATGLAPLSYQWQFNGAAIVGATGTNLTLNNILSANAGNYTVVITNKLSSATSAVAVLTVLVPPSITAQPLSRTNIGGTSASFGVSATGTAPLRFQWQFNGANIPGATDTTLTLSSVQVADAGSYAVVVTNVAGATTSTVATLTVWVPPAITVQPQSRTNIAGTTALFSTAAASLAPLSYQWQFNGVTIQGATESTLALNNVQPPDAGGYTVVAANAAGAVTSAVAVLTVWVPPSIAVQPLSRTNIAGTTATFNAAATGTAPLSYQWQFNGANIQNATDTTLTLNSVQSSDAGNYAVVVTNAAGVVTSLSATLTVLLSPAITVQPTTQTVPAGTNVSFNVVAAGALPLSYQWQFNGANLADGGPFSGATTPTLSINYALAANVGTYSVVVTNIAGSVTSSLAGLFVTPAACVSAPAGLAGWWPGDGTAQDIGGTNNGVLQGGASASAVGFVGSAFGFDGTNGSVRIQDSPSLKPSTLTVEAWVRFNALDSASSGGAPAALQYIVFKQNTRSNNFEGYVLSKNRISGNDVLQFQVSSALGQTVALQSLTLLTTGVWYHVTGVRDTGSLLLYVNGQLEAQTNVSFPQDYGNFPLYFGTSGQSYYDGKFAGVLDEVSLYNRALSQPEILADYHAANTGKCRTPSILTQPQGGSRYWGGSFTFSSAAGGALPLRYQWLKDSLVLSGATNTSLSLANLQLAQAGNYALSASNAYGAATSTPAFLNVRVADLALSLSPSGPQGTPGLMIAGVPGQLYGIQYSAGFGPANPWIGLTNLTLTAATNVWYDPQGATAPQRYYRIVQGPIPIGVSSWEASIVGALWSDDFSRPSLGPNWIILGGANASIVGNELLLDHSTVNLSRQVYYQPRLTCSDEWTIRWTQRFGVLNAGSRGVGVGLKNFQTAGGSDRGYNGLLSGAGADFGKMEIQRFDGNQQVLAAAGSAISMAAGDLIDCSLTRSGWTVIATASNRANVQVSTASLTFSDPANLIAPTISRICIYPLQGTVYLDGVSFTINRPKPARFIVVGASLSEGYDASSYSNGFVRVIQRSFTQAVCNDSSSYNTTTNSVSVLPEILAHQPGTAILSIGGNDLQFGYPAAQWQAQYSNLVAQLQLAGVQVKHCLPPPRNVVDVTPLKNWILATYPAKDVIDVFTPLLQGANSLNPAYDIGDGVHLNDAGHLLMGSIISTNLP